MKRLLMIVLPYIQREYSSPSTKLRTWLALPYGALAVATYNQSRAKVSFLDCNVEYDYRLSVEKAILRFKPDVVGFSMTFDFAYNYLGELLKIVNDCSSKKPTIVVGGAATTSAYCDILAEQPLVDAVCYRDGEEPMRRLLESSDMQDFLRWDASWVTRQSFMDGIVYVKSPVPNLDDAIGLNYNFINTDNYSLQEEFSPHINDIPVKKRFYMLTSRGCPYRCAFCYKSRVLDRKMQYASVDKVVEHAAYLKERFSMNILTLCDDQLLFHHKRAKELFRKLIPLKLRIEIYQGTSVNFIDNEMAELMYAAGMRRVMINLESGSQTMLDIMIEKPVHLDQAADVVGILRKNNIWASAIFVMGYPGETDALRKETMEWVRKADPDWCVFNAAIPIRGTKLYDLCVANGYIKPDKLGKLDYGNYTINVPGYPPEYVKDQIYRMNIDANFVNNRSMRIGDYNTAITMFDQVVGGYPSHAFAHYYMGQGHEALGNKTAARKHYDLYRQCCAGNPQWAEYAKFFNLKEV